MGDLFYVIGASGAGKDSIIAYARERIDGQSPVAFAHRYITRPEGAGGENHVALTAHEFACRAERGCFAMKWNSRSTWYGVGIEIDRWLADGLSVVVNGSRAYLDEAMRRYPELIPVLIVADPRVLFQRLIERGRESAGQIDERLRDAERLNAELAHPHLVRIDNNGALAVAGAHFLRLVQERNDGACG